MQASPSNPIYLILVVIVYHSCWCPVGTHHRGISSYDIDLQGITPVNMPEVGQYRPSSGMFTRSGNHTGDSTLTVIHWLLYNVMIIVESLERLPSTSNGRPAVHTAVTSEYSGCDPCRCPVSVEHEGIKLASQSEEISEYWANHIARDVLACRSRPMKRHWLVGASRSEDVIGGSDWFAREHVSNRVCIGLLDIKCCNCIKPKPLLSSTVYRMY